MLCTTSNGMTQNNGSAGTKQFVDIRDIREEIVILKNGSFRSLIEVGSINFELKSQDEQTAIIQAFQNFLNSADFPVQIAVHSKKLDIKPYLEYLNKLVETIDHELLKIQAIEYTRFVSGLTELRNIMSKKFYVVVPFYIIESSNSKKGFVESLKTMIKPSEAVKKIDEKQFESYRAQMMQRVELILEGLLGMGMSARVLEQEELKNTFYDLYNA